MRSVDKRIAELRKLVEQSRPCNLTVILKSGKEIVVSPPADAIDMFQDPALMDEIANVTTDNPEYQALAHLLAGLCHPAPDRHIEDYEE